MTILGDDARALLDSLEGPNQRWAAQYRGDRPDRQPIHTVYGGAQLFQADIAQRLGKRAIESLDEYAPDPFTFARALGMEGSERLPHKRKAKRALIERYQGEPDAVRVREPHAYHACLVYERVREKLAREAVEDFRIDFEDGYGNRPDEEEDGHAVHAAQELARGMRESTLPPFIGIRIKPLNDEMKRRSVRTLDRFLSTVLDRVGALPSGFVITLPKVPIPEQVAVLAKILGAIEEGKNLTPRSLKLELMIELTQSIFDATGSLNLPRLIAAADGRCTGAHFGTYDYTASCAITAAHQTMDHGACLAALHLIKIAYANTGVFLSDGATNVLPVPIHRGESLGRKQLRENRDAVHAAWALAFRHTQLSLRNGFYQGWDLHPAQIPVRYAACYDFFLRGFDAAATRLRNFVEKAAQATLVGDVFDDAATGQGLLNYFLRAYGAGAVSLEELATTGLSVEEIQTRSFVKILAARTTGK
jgi:citrate lyase beta subunit